MKRICCSILCFALMITAMAVPTLAFTGGYTAAISETMDAGIGSESSETAFRSVQIGSESEPVEYTRVLRTSSYSEEKLSALYGDLIGDFVSDGELVYSVYRIQDENANVFAIRNRTDSELFAKYYPWFAECIWYVNGEKYGNNFQLVIPPQGVGLVTFWDVDSLYKELELPNGTPIHLELSIPLPDFENGFYGNVMRLDLGQISN